MNSSNQEFKGLLEDKTTPKGHSLFSLMPLISSSVLIFFTTLTLAISLLSNEFLKLEKLSHSNLMKFGIFTSTLPGFITICALHFTVFEKRYGKKNFFFVLSSFISGMTAQVSLIFISFNPRVSQPSWTVVFEQETFPLSVFMVSSVLFETFSFSLKMEKEDLKIFSMKSKFISVIVVFTFIQGTTALVLQGYSEESLEFILEVLDYFMFYIHLVYFSTFYYDLQDIKLGFFLKQEYDDLVNSSTF